MAGQIEAIVIELRKRQAAWRRARNLRAGRAPSHARPGPAESRAFQAPPSGEPVLAVARSPASAAVRAIGAAGALAAICGAFLIASHARNLAAAAGALGAVAQPFGAPRSVDQFRSALPGIAFSVPEHGGISLSPYAGGALLVAAGIRSAPPVHIDLCSQMAGRSGGRLVPVRIGYSFDDVARWVAGNSSALRNVVLNGAGDADMPQVQVSGNAGPGDEVLQLSWDSRTLPASWVGDATYGQVVQGRGGQVVLRGDGWLVWRQDAALHIQRRASAACPQAGELVVQAVRSAPDVPASKAQVVAYPAGGQPVTAWLPAGRYQVPSAAGSALEDQALFLELRERGMLRLGASGLAELVPRDLAAWRAAPETARAGALASWDNVRLDRAGIRLIGRLYRMADGEFVRDQVRVFNAERRLLAWRAASAGVGGTWRATVDSAPAPITEAMPVTSARLFSAVEPGWLPWGRVESWPEASPGAPARLTLTLSRPARTGDTVHLMLIGRPGMVQGASIRRSANACTGRACPSPDAVQSVVLDLLPGARTVSIDAAPLDMSALAVPGDQRYRHLRVAASALEWQPLAPAAGLARPIPAAEVTLEDRHGNTLWSGGAPTQAALDAGLAPLLGFRADHASSIAGMLARLPSPGGTPHAARLTLDLALQSASQGALACIGMRRGHWDGKTCSGGQAPPPGRRAGIVIIDTETGDVLAAAGMGGAPVTAANWNEVRNFDRTDPARSPLRLPAFQHDGGAHSSPGSTFKIISALGLEQAALHDPQLEALLAGMPLPAINRMALDRGFGFRTDSSTYPAETRQAHITNYRDQHLDRRAQDGKLGLAQALTYSLNTWFAWSGELSDRSLFGRSEGGAPDLQPLEIGALDGVRPIVAMAHRLGFGQALRLDGGLLPADFSWSGWDALQATASNIDPIHTRHELRQMSIGLRMQATPLQMALAAGAVGQGRFIAPRLLLSLDSRQADVPTTAQVGVRLDRIRAGMKGVIDAGTAAGAFRAARFDALRRGLFGKTGTAPTGPQGDGALATVWFTGWLEPGSLPGQTHRLAMAAFVSHSEATGGEHAAPIVAAVLASSLEQNQEQRGK